jgi:sortase A
VIFFIAFVGAAGIWYWEAQQTNLTQPPPPVVVEESTEIKSEASETVTVTVLPGNPTPSPDVDSSPIPQIYNEWIQSEIHVASVLQGDLSEQRPIRIAIPKLEIDAPVIAGTDWEALKRGAGHYLGSAFPGERGNMVITAHNDIFGELFRYLDELEPGDEFTVYDALERKYEYVVRTKRIVEPNEVSVLNSSPEPLATLITCYPYLIDSQRLVVQAELLR